MGIESNNALEGISVAIFESDSYSRDIARRLGKEKMKGAIFPNWIPGALRNLLDPDEFDVVVIHIPLTFNGELIERAIEEISWVIGVGLKVVLLETDMLIDEAQMLSDRVENIGAHIVSKKSVTILPDESLDRLVNVLSEIYN